MRSNRQPVGAASSDAENRRGAIVVLAAFLLIVFCCFVSFAVDVGYLCVVRTELQRSADSAALAGIGVLVDEDGTLNLSAAGLTAQQFGGMNGSAGGVVLTLIDADIKVGVYDALTNQVVETPGEANAIEVTAWRRADRGTAVQLFFAPVLGIQQADVSARAIAILDGVSAANVLPLALRDGNFGTIDPKVSDANPGKDGPSAPANGEMFEVDEVVILYIYGKGKQSPVHLTLDINSPGPGASQADVKKVLKGAMDPVVMKAGWDYYVFNEGTGSGGYGSALDDRLKTAIDDPLRDVVVPIVSILPGSKNDDDRLSGKIRVVDFAAVHLDGTVEEDVVDPNNPSQTITVKYLVGTISRRSISYVGGAPQSANGVGGDTVVTTHLAW